MYFEQADDQPNAQPNAQANILPDEHIITKLNLLFNFIYNKGHAGKIGLSENDKEPLILLLKKLELYVENTEIYEYFSEEAILDEKIKLWAIKELYLSPHKVYLNNLKKHQFNLRFLKAKKYITSKKKYELHELISYFVVCLKNELEEDKNVK